MQKDYRKFQADIPATMRKLQLGSKLTQLTHNDFLFAVRDWITVRAAGKR